MKKKILGVALIAAMAVAAGWNFNQSKNEVGLSNVALANVEALANSEVDNVKCNRDIDATCILVNNIPLKGERY